eukprot:3069810-Rhodomonas_salina.1
MSVNLMKYPSQSASFVLSSTVRTGRPCNAMNRRTVWYYVSTAGTAPVVSDSAPVPRYYMMQYRMGMGTALCRTVSPPIPSDTREVGQRPNHVDAACGARLVPKE